MLAAARLGSMPHTLVLLRHGQSDWNQKNLFTGWVDVRLSELGMEEAKRAGELLVEQGVMPDVLHTSVLTRAIQTANIALDIVDRAWLDKAETMEKYGPEQFQLWRRSFDVPPPPLSDDSEWSQVGDPRYANLSDDEMPRTECLKDVIARMLPYWREGIIPDLAAGRTVLVAAHGNSLRALVKHLDGISDQDIAELNIPTGIPLVYELGDDFMPLGPSRYLDPEAAAAGAAAVAAQGRK
jgi:2,3-bisphosphoglycerate-dependent phosphoglycerate mutase